ncbi:recombinase family protein [Alteromonas ponticola]|uniref:Recombinase family protein n=1 Tax=Alteromonas ponticola TaxID=2720613 RepID=A0ABX1R4A1_9ALTE|nr:recombinase family protein [Alteromonas ponticola]NMH61275.1 recombinase family protein [Alteromonas ponticola]
MPKSYRYIRFSSQIQRKGSSYERQLYAVEAWMEQHPDVELSEDSYEDLGLSGYKGAHLDNAFGKLLVAVESNKIVNGDYILIEAVDRLGRLEPMEMLPILQKIVKAGVTIVSLDDFVQYNTSSLNNGLLQVLIGKFQQAHQYSKNLSRRISESWQHRRRKARRGEQIKLKSPFWINKDLSLNVKHADILKFIYERYLLGDGQRYIQRQLVQSWPEIFGDGFRKDWLLKTEGNKTKMVNPGTILKWLQNKAAIGYWGDIPNVFPPAIPEPLFYKVQNALASRTKRASKSQHYFVGGLTKCRCGSNMTFVKNVGRNGHVNINGRCTKRGRIGFVKTENGIIGCDNKKTIPLVIIDIIAHWCLPDAIQEVTQGQTTKDTQDKIYVIEGKINEISTEINRLTKLVLAGVQEAEDQTIELNLKRAKLQKDKELLTEKLGNAADLIELNQLLEIERGYRQDYLKLNRLLQQAGYKLVCDGQNVTVHIPNGDAPKFKYLGFDNSGKGSSSQCYQVLIFSNEKIVNVPRFEPVTLIDGSEYIPQKITT